MTHIGTTITLDQLYRYIDSERLALNTCHYIPMLIYRALPDDAWNDRTMGNKVFNFMISGINFQKEFFSSFKESNMRNYIL